MVLRLSKLVLALTVCGLAASASRADDYTIDGVHTSITFKIPHLGISWIHGRFNTFSGNFSVAAADASFALTIKADSIDTGVAKRDAHLRSPTFFNTNQFPEITFKSTGVKSIDGGYEVTGDLTMHGVTKPVAMKLTGGKTAQFPKGVQRIGYTTTLTLKRSDFGMTELVGPVGDEVHLDISFEGVKK
jgi:polyisoprenoid-binding protein YceI